MQERVASTHSRHEARHLTRYAITLQLNVGRRVAPLRPLMSMRGSRHVFKHEDFSHTAWC
jgi:hypothetical protein